MPSTTLQTVAMLDTVESAYRLQTGEERWAGELLNCASPWLDVGLWSFVATYHRDEKGVPRVSACVDTGAPYDVRAAVDNGSAALDDAGLDAIYAGHAAHTLSQVWEVHPSLKKVFDDHTPPPTRDLCQITCRSSDGQGTLLGAGLETPTRIADAWLMRYTRVAAHITAGHRLRRLLDGADERPSGADHPLREAVLSPAGDLLHAEGDATSETAREALKRAALMVDRARTRKGRAEADESLVAWKALVAGRWTIVDHFDSDDRRYLVAMVNPPELQSPLALERLEAIVAELAALGHSQKYIAYELGLHESQVSRSLKSALTRLGLKRRTDLVALVRDLRSSK